MMATTHALVGLLAGLAFAPLAPGSGSVIVFAGIVGGIAPDLDALGAHRKDLHFPVYGAVFALSVATVAVATRYPAAVAAAALLAGWALHSISDVLGGGRSLRPWSERVERAVYCHAQGRWWRPRRVVPYDGAPADFGLACILAGLAFAAAGTSLLRGGIVLLVVISIPYVVFRKRLPAYLEAAIHGSNAQPERSDARR